MRILVAERYKTADGRMGNARDVIMGHEMDQKAKVDVDRKDEDVTPGPIGPNC